MTKRKPTYEQAMALQRGQATQKRQAKEAARLREANEMTPEQKAAWKVEYNAAVAAYRAAKAAAKEQA